MVQEVLNVPLCPSKEIVETNDVVPVSNQTITEMGPEKARAAGHKNCLGAAHV
jgi:hypothetical protein